MNRLVWVITSVLIVMGMSMALPSSLIAADYYVRDGASGNGSNWADAWDQLPSTLTRGDTYYIADGTYPAYDFDTPADGTTLIYVTKATVAQHGTETGWSSAYGDGQATWQSTGIPWKFSTAYWDVSGVVGSGNSGHGFGVNVTSTAANVRGIRILAGNLTIRRTEIWSNSPCSVADGSKQDGIYSTAPVSNITIEYSYIHDWKRTGLLFSSVTDVVIQNNYFYHTYSTSGSHGQAIQLGPGATRNYEIRYNMFKDTHGTGHIVYLDATHSDIDIYGNVFWEDEQTAACGIFSTSQSVGNTSGDTSNNIDIHNNTWIGVNGRSPTPSAMIDHNGRGSNNYAYNNLWYDSLAGFSQVTHDYNWFYRAGTFSEPNAQYGSGDPFIDSATGNFRLVSPTNPGISLPSPFGIDMDGFVRGSGGAWGRGAYEYSGTAIRPNLPPNVWFVFAK